MFKVIRENVPQPHFYMICDRDCGQLIMGGIDLNQPEQPQQVKFIQQCIAQGWRVGLDHQICTIHVQAEKGQKRDAPMILLANGRLPAFPLKG